MGCSVIVVARERRKKWLPSKKRSEEGCRNSASLIKKCKVGIKKNIDIEK
jgi:hypothetical protein